MGSSASSPKPKTSVADCSTIAAQNVTTSTLPTTCEPVSLRRRTNSLNGASFSVLCSCRTEDIWSRLEWSGIGVTHFQVTHDRQSSWPESPCWFGVIAVVRVAAACRTSRGEKEASSVEEGYPPPPLMPWCDAVQALLTMSLSVGKLTPTKTNPQAVFPRVMSCRAQQAAQLTAINDDTKLFYAMFLLEPAGPTRTSGLHFHRFLPPRQGMTLATKTHHRWLFIPVKEASDEVSHLIQEEFVFMCCDKALRKPCSSGKVNIPDRFLQAKTCVVLADDASAAKRVVLHVGKLETYGVIIEQYLCLKALEAYHLGLSQCC